MSDLDADALREVAIASGLLTTAEADEADAFLRELQAAVRAGEIPPALANRFAEVYGAAIGAAAVDRRNAKALLTLGEARVMVHATAWPKRYRNHFCASEGHDDWATLQALCARGLMRVNGADRQLSGGDTVFSVTEDGMRALERAYGRARAEGEQ